MKQNRLEMFVPAEFIEPSGLVRLSGVGTPAPPAGEAQIVSGILGSGAPVAFASLPSFFDQVYVFMTHQELFGYMPEMKELGGLDGATERTVDDIIDFVSDESDSNTLVRSLVHELISQSWQNCGTSRVRRSSSVSTKPTTSAREGSSTRSTSWRTSPKRSCFRARRCSPATSTNSRSAQTAMGRLRPRTPRRCTNATKEETAVLLQRENSKPLADVPRTKNDSMLEELSESISRALAARVSRRSFLGRMSTGAVAASIGTSAIALTRPPAAAACTHNCSISCVDLTGSNNCPTNAYTTCTCGAWCFSDGGCSSGIRRWEDCCGINYCNAAGGCQCVNGYPTCCNYKTYAGGCGTVGQSVVVCRLRFCVSSCTVVNNYCS